MNRTQKTGLLILRVAVAVLLHPMMVVLAVDPLVRMAMAAAVVVHSRQVVPVE